MKYDAMRCDCLICSAYAYSRVVRGWNRAPAMALTQRRWRDYVNNL